MFLYAVEHKNEYSNKSLDHLAIWPQLLKSRMQSIFVQLYGVTKALAIWPLFNHCPQLKHFLSKAVLQRIQEWSDKIPAPKFVFFLKLWIVIV